MNRFKNTRLRIERIQDGHICGAWIVEGERDKVTVELSESADLKPGETVAICASCVTGEARFNTLVVNRENRRASFSLPREIRIEQSKNAPRVRVSGVRVMLMNAILGCEVSEIDVSTGGFGLTSSLKMEVGDRGIVRYVSEGFVGHFGVECRYCDLRSESRYRQGLRIVRLDRVAQAKWASYLVQLQTGFPLRLVS